MVKPMDLVPFHTELIPEAGALLAQRHRRDRTVRPELPVRFEDPAIAQAAVEATWRRPGVSGVAALSEGRLLGYLIGDLVIDHLWGRSAWVRLPGCALAPDQNAELVRDLYAALGRRWVAYGCFFHFALVPTADRALLDAWFALSFGVEQVHGLVNLDGLDLSAPISLPDVEIRRAGPDDRDTLAELSDIIWRHLAQAPVWGITLPEREADIRAGYAGLVDDPTATVWLASDRGQAVGFQCYFPAEAADDNLLVSEQCAELSIGGTRESARGQGIGRALTRHGLAHARASGYRTCLADWRSASLLASRFWPRQGFRPVAYRLVRRIDARIAWASGQGEEREWPA